jgi:hypothetical protein
LNDGDLESFWLSRVGKDPVARIGLLLWGTKEQIDQAFKEYGDEYWIAPLGMDARSYWSGIATNIRQTLSRAFGSTGQLYGKGADEYLGMMRQVGLDVARQHSLAVIDDYDNNRGAIKGLLDHSQMSKYHHTAFRLNKLRPSDYGGTMISGSNSVLNKVEFFFTGNTYCPDCDLDHEVRN